LYNFHARDFLKKVLEEVLPSTAGLLIKDPNALYENFKNGAKGL
jgi:hypothetical protein